VSGGPLRSVAALRARAASLPRRRVAVAMATGTETLRAAIAAAEGGLARPILVGPGREVEEGLRSLGADPAGFEIVRGDDPAAAAGRAVALVREGSADVLLKGAVSTSTLIRAVLDTERGLRADRLLSDVFVFDFAATPEPRIVGITDGGVVPRPTLEQKREILRNGVDVFRALGVAAPRVALVAAVETVTAAFPSTAEAAELARTGGEGIEGEVLVEGPMGLDLALSPAAVEAKGYRSEIRGAADLLLFPDLESANLAAKAVEYAVPLEPGHVIVGARAPVLIPSRSETAGARLTSIALGALLVRGR
jgi:phosphate butyryltransferase